MIHGKLTQIETNRRDTTALRSAEDYSARNSWGLVERRAIRDDERKGDAQPHTSHAEQFAVASASRRQTTDITSTLVSSGLPCHRHLDLPSSPRSLHVACSST